MIIQERTLDNSTCYLKLKKYLFLINVTRILCIVFCLYCAVCTIQVVRWQGAVQLQRKDAAIWAPQMVILPAVRQRQSWDF